MSRPGTSHILHRLVAFTVALGVLAACSDATDPADDPLANLNEMVIWSAVEGEVSLFTHTAEANANLRLALGSAIPPAQPIPPELFGQTMVYDQETDAWVTASAPAVPDNVLRVMWYEVAGSFVAVPVAERGFIELTELTGPNPELTRLHVRAIRTDTGPTTLADYAARFGETTNATDRTRTFGAEGMVSDGERQLSFDTGETETERLGSGEVTDDVWLQLSAAGFSYEVTLRERRSAQGGPTEVTLAARVMVEGVESRVELTLDEDAGGAVTGSGALFHGGQRLADVAVSGTSANPQWTFTRPDGTDYTRNQQTRLGDLISILLTPLAVSAQYFS